MLARWLFVTDLHKRAIESTNIKGTREVTKLIQQDILKCVNALGVTHIAILGDWYHRGYHSIGPAYSDMEMDRRISESVNGNVYLVVGNHFYLERDENPEMYIIQPCEYIRPQDEIETPDSPLFKVVPSVKLGSVLISFFHYNKMNKDYINVRDNDVTYHVGCYHDDACLPGWIAEAEGFVAKATSSSLVRMYSNVDLAIHGHIHMKHGMVPLEKPNGTRIPLFIPGSLGITQNSEKFKHPNVALPLLTINDDSSVQLSTVTFKTYIDKLRFYDTAKTKKKNNGNKAVDVPTEMQSFSATKIASLFSYVNSLNYDSRQIKLLDAAAKGPVHLTSAVSILSEVKKPNEPDGVSGSVT